jgi:hypothetical protein
MQKLNIETIKKNLPSKEFIRVLGICTGAIIVILIVGSLFGTHSIFNKKSGPLVEANGTVNELLIQDSNTNGIPDWEESLWGFDPKGDGVANKQGIEQKKLAGNITPSQSNIPLNETDKFSQSLLSSCVLYHCLAPSFADLGHGTEGGAAYNNLIVFCPVLHS